MNIPTTIVSDELTLQGGLSESYWAAEKSVSLMEITLGDILRNAEQAAPNRLALVEGVLDRDKRRRWTYSELLSDSEKVARALLTYFNPGDRVAVWASNIPEWQLLLYGCAIAGVVLVTVNPGYKKRELKHILSQAEVSGLFAMESYRGFDMLEAANELTGSLPFLKKIVSLNDFDDFISNDFEHVDFPTIKPSDPCVIMFTSGTTGLQKGVIFHHTGVINGTYFTQIRGGLKTGGVFVNPMPMFHIGGLGHAGVGAVTHQATHVLVPYWDVTLFLGLVESEKGSYSLLVPTMIEAILSCPEIADYDLSTLSNFISGASIVESHLIKRTFSELGCTISNVYGQTEMHGVICAIDTEDTDADKAETIGRPMPHAEIKIGDVETAEILPIGEQGEICVRGYMNMIGYYGMPEESAKTIDPDGWLHSGDIGSMDERGYLKITGRIKEMIIRGGENIYPREIENLLMEHPKIEKVAVVGLPDPYWGEQVAAVIIPVSLEDKIEPKDLHDFCRSHLASYKTPAFWSFVKEFPLTETGKIKKYELIEKIVSGELLTLEK